MEYFDLLEFAALRSRRVATLAQVMPIGDDWIYFVLLSDGYLNQEVGETRVRSFDDLRVAMRSDDGLHALEMARASGELSEGRHEIPDVLASCLSRHGSAALRVRQWSLGADAPTTVALASSELAHAWPGSGTEEIEIVDQFAHWYLRMKDDEALIFLAVRGCELAEQIRRCRAYCREVNGDFGFAL